MLYLDNVCKSALHPKIFMFTELQPDNDMLDEWIHALVHEDLDEGCFLDIMPIGKDVAVVGSDPMKIFKQK